MEKIVSILLYVLLLSSIYLIFSDAFVQSVNEKKAKAQASAMVKKKTTKKEKDKKDGYTINTYIKTMLSVTKGRKNDNDLIMFYQESILLAIAGFFIGYLVMTPKVAPLSAAIGLALPFIINIYRLQEIRNQASQEGEVLAAEILNNYKIYHYNMLEAIRNSAESIPDSAPYSKKMLIELAYEFNTISSTDDIKQAVDRFKFGINTTWATLLATNIELAQIDGIKVTAAMEDLIASIVKARKTKEEAKRQGSEGRKMLFFLAPAIYLLSVISSNKVFGLTLTQFFHNQFKTDTGSTWFLAVCISYILSIIIASFMSRNKMDI